MAKTREYVGPIPHHVWEVVEDALEAPIAVSGDYARSYAVYIALAASMGWITTVTVKGDQFTRKWRATSRGVAALENKEHLK